MGSKKKDKQLGKIVMSATQLRRMANEIQQSYGTKDNVEIKAVLSYRGKGNEKTLGIIYRKGETI